LGSGQSRAFVVRARAEQMDSSRVIQNVASVTADRETRRTDGARVRILRARAQRGGGVTG
jgi:hypothetical protein